jgi:hypothetical protein
MYVSSNVLKVIPSWKPTKGTGAEKKVERRRGTKSEEKQNVSKVSSSRREESGKVSQVV